MNREDVKKLYVNIAKGGILASLFSPLVLSAPFFFPFIVPKTLFFQIAVTVALFFYILAVSLDKKYAPKFDILTKLVLAFFGVYVLAAALGVDPARSFFGTYERMLSVVTMAHFVALYLIVRSVFVSQKDWLWLLRTFVLASVLVSLYGVGQKLGIGWVYHAGIDRIDSTIGNAAFVAGYLLFAIFFACMLLMKESRLAFRVGAAISIALNVVIIYFTGTRGAAVGLAVAGIVLFLAYLFKPIRVALIKKKHIQWALAIIAFALLAVVMLEGGGIYQSFQRFSSISLSDATVQTRLLSVSTGWEGFMARPILGWGPENYNLVFDKYYNPKLYPTENWFDHAHNIFFDIATTMGIAGLLAYAALFIYLVFRIITFARSAPEKYWIGMFSFALIAAYFTQNIFVFDSLVTYLPFFIFCAFAGSGFTLGEEGAHASEDKARKFYNPSLKTALILLPLFAGMVYWVDVRPALGAYHTVGALQTSLSSADEALGHFERALAYSNFGREEIRGKLADYVSDLLHEERITDEALRRRAGEFVIQEMENSIARGPLNFRNYLYYATFLSGNADALASVDIPDAHMQADKILARAQELAPRKPMLYLQWGEVKMLAGDSQGAVTVLAKAVVLNPNVIDLQIRLALAYRKAGAHEQALTATRAIFNADTHLDVRAYIDLAENFAALGAYDEAVASAQKAVAGDPSLAEQAESFIRALDVKKAEKVKQ
ncbi:MAG: O-antigen ligase family protein [Candidatus Azambacteria bacterium]|nr:O-antigen ligase family protein [Candidatus Azambacteria bacterium]